MVNEWRGWYFQEFHRWPSLAASFEAPQCHFCKEASDEALLMGYTFQFFHVERTS